MNMRPYIGVESGSQLVPELSRLIGSAMFIEDCICMGIIPCSLLSISWDGCDGCGKCDESLNVGR